MPTHYANHPFPYAPIRIVDVSPYRSSIRSKGSGGRVTRDLPRDGRGLRGRVAAILGALVAVSAVAAGTGAAPLPGGTGGEFRLGPGHAMPVTLHRDVVQREVALPTRPVAEPGFRLGLGLAMPASLSR